MTGSSTESISRPDGRRGTRLAPTAVLTLVAVGLSIVSGVQCETVKRIKSKFEPAYEITNVYVAPQLELLPIRRVVVLPFLNGTAYAEAGSAVSERFALSLAKRNRFEVTTVTNATNLPLLQQMRRKGRFDRQMARALGEALGVEGIIVGTVTHYMPYRPLAIGLRVVMISAQSGEVLWSIDETLDSNELLVANLARRYYYERIDPEASVYRVDRVLSSIRQYSEFVCYEIAQTLP